jgi:hypothetical protein
MSWLGVFQPGTLNPEPLNLYMCIMQLKVFILLTFHFQIYYRIIVLLKNLFAKAPAGYFRAIRGS